MKLRKYVFEGEAVPKWYGHAWRDFRYQPTRTVCYPIPFNLIMHYLRRLYHWSLISLWMKHSAKDDLFREGWSKGYKDGQTYQIRISKPPLGEDGG